MRQVLSISLPQSEVKTIKRKTKERGFKTVSDYIKFLVKEDNDDDWISDEELMEDIRIAEKEYKEGKLIKANSLADLL